MTRARRMTCLLRLSIRPDLKIAALMTNMQPSVRLAGWLNPEKPSSGVNTPVTINKAMIRMAVVSIRKVSLTKRNIPKAIIMNVI